MTVPAHDTTATVVRPFAEPIRPIRTFEAAIEQIIEGIEAHQLHAGDRLPTETELATLLGISKPTLRQALRILERAGVIESRRGKSGGIFLVSDLIPSAVLSSEIALESDAVLDILRGRRVLETAVTEFAMTAARAEDYAELDRINALMKRSIGNRPMMLRVDSRFHRAVARASHNLTLIGSMRLLAREFAPVRDTYGGGVEVDWRTLDVHTRQVAAMRGGSREDVLVILDEHFKMAEEAFADAIRSTWDELFGTAPGRDANG
jgi:GntR family transcriptional regulator, transcriptional repressor for pyruvate dehydrogenase complex